MAEIRELKDKNKVTIYPKTLSKAIYNEDGTRASIPSIVIVEDLELIASSWVDFSAAELGTQEVKILSDNGIKYMADIDVVGLTKEYKVSIQPDKYGEENLSKYNLSLVNKVRLYAKEKPTNNIQLLSIIGIKK